jgi:hypothetical protein
MIYIYRACGSAKSPAVEATRDKIRQLEQSVATLKMDMKDAEKALKIGIYIYI